MQRGEKDVEEDRRRGYTENGDGVEKADERRQHRQWKLERSRQFQVR